MLVNDNLMQLIVQRNGLKYKLQMLQQELDQCGRFSSEREALEEKIKIIFKVQAILSRKIDTFTNHTTTNHITTSNTTTNHITTSNTTTNHTTTSNITTSNTTTDVSASSFNPSAVKC